MTPEQLREAVRASGTLRERVQMCQRRWDELVRDESPPRHGPVPGPVLWDDDDYFIAATLADVEDHLRIWELS